MSTLIIFWSRKFPEWIASLKPFLLHNLVWTFLSFPGCEHGEGEGCRAACPWLGKPTMFLSSGKKEDHGGKVHVMSRTSCMVFYPCSLRNLLICRQELTVQPGNHHHLLRATFCFRLQEERETQESTCLMSHRLAQVMVWNRSAWSNTGHTENLQVITQNDYSERELASK